MSCKYCNSKGFIESSILKDNNNFPMIMKCPNPNCEYTQNYYKTIKDRMNPKKEDTFNIEVDPNMKPEDIVNYINKQLKGQNKETKDEYKQSNIGKEYPNLDKKLVKQYKDLDNKIIQLSTPFGMVSTTSLSEANRIVGILRLYLDKQKELYYADSFNNIEIFPLDKSLNRSLSNLDPDNFPSGA